MDILKVLTCVDKLFLAELQKWYITFWTKAQGYLCEVFEHICNWLIAFNVLIAFQKLVLSDAENVKKLDNIIDNLTFAIQLAEIVAFL